MPKKLVEKPSIKKWTYKDYLKLDDDVRYEIINGRLIMLPGPFEEHQNSSIKLSTRFEIYIEKNNLGKVYAAPFDVIFSNKEVCQPDIIFVSNKNLSIIKERGIFGSPDLLVEIISSKRKKYDRKIKYNIYEKYGVKEYWLVDPKDKTVEVFNLNQEGKYEIFCSFEKEGMAKSKILEGFEVEIKEIFE